MEGVVSPPPETTQDLRQRKKEEQDRINGRNARIKRCRNELEYVNKVTYFVTKLPNGCRRDGLWRAYEHHHNLMDVSIPSKKDRWGNTFGFLRFVEVVDAEAFKHELGNIMVDGKKVSISIARWDKDCDEPRLKAASKTPLHHPLPSSSVWNGDPLAYVNAVAGKPVDGGAYNKKEGVKDVSVILAPKNSPVSHPLAETSLLGSITNAGILNDLPFYLKRWSGLDDCVVRYLGGLTIILTFPTKQDSRTYLESKGNLWGSFFSSLTTWDGIHYPEERLAWITIRGVPPHLFGTPMINKIAASCGKVVDEVDVSNLESNLAFTRVPILTRDLEKVNKKVVIAHQGTKFDCWVYEDSEEWVPGFMRVNSPNHSNEEDEQNSGSSSPASHHADRGCDESDTVLETTKSMHVGSRALGRLGAVDCSNDSTPTLNSQANVLDKNHLGEKKHNDEVLSNGPCEADGPMEDNFSHSLHEDGLDNSDPFNLGPIIDEVMAHHNKKGTSVQGSKVSRYSKDEKAGGNRSYRKHNKVPDLNKEIHDFTRSKLSRYLITRKRKMVRKRGNSQGASLISDALDADSPDASQNDHEAHSCPNFGGSSTGMGDDHSVLNENLVRDAIEQEVLDTIRVNSMVDLDLTAQSDFLRNLISLERNVKSFQ
ncbi:hypothetical protein QVD17_20120 [Tagetes erecta]|uniref:RRM domain-containing protein n=1 Tax=Tagetes erecta TaxID=13708 RepID=A0AAD8KR28_TARER|nr:hypothetical protein QVD17_20120 [Tagetes erecta]